MPQTNSQVADTEAAPGLQSRMASAFAGAIVTSLLMTPFDVVKTRQQSQTLVTKQPLPQVQRRPTNYWVPRNARPQQMELVFKRLCAPSTAGVIGAESASLRTSASLCLCSDALVFDAQGRPVDVGQSWDHPEQRICMRGKRGGSAGKAGLWKRLGFTPKIERVAGERITRNTGGNATHCPDRRCAERCGGPSTMIYFVGYDYLRSWMGARMKASAMLSPYEQFASLFAGCIARTAAASVISPLELVRTRMQSSATHDLRTVMRGVSSEIGHSGLGTLWRGLVPTLWRDVPFSAIYWFGYEQWNHRVFAPIFDGRQHSSGASDTLTRLMTSFCSGAASGIVAAIITTPSMLSPKSHVSQHRTFASMLRHIAPRLMKIAPSCAIMISSYELGKIVLSK
ncbi:mitochondrial carrier [Linderina pennispora]|uniref:Mitochondrial carrier n=1 Tax=Linderina pennispora TaxID=61395 RepID=A0A1Y1WLP6_9FUNG|nr:mitochondrial carrier [Linderina pennispora]ORX74422.1 mitochondrial carrier [Linderina pennispora]